MIKRKNFFTALLCVLMTLACTLCAIFAGCAEYTPPQNTGDNPAPIDPNPPIKPTDPENNDNFSVQLVIKDNNVWKNFSNEYYEASDGKGGSHDQGWIYWDDIMVQWTDRESNARYTANFDEDGKAVYAGLDGDYKVTLTALPTGFTYEPNENYADNITKNIEIVIYKLLPTGSIKGSLTLGGTQEKIDYYQFSKTGAYRITLENPDSAVMCAFHTSRQGLYSLRTLADVTADLVNPKLSVYKGQLSSHLVFWYEDKDDGGAANTFTKNIYWQYELPTNEVGNTLFFKLYSTSKDGDKGYPMTLDFLIERDGDFSNEDKYQTTKVSVTEDFGKTPPKPDGTFTWCARSDRTEELQLNQKAVILNTEAGRGNKNVVMGTQATQDDGYYYYYDYDQTTDVYTLTDRVYAAVNMNNEVMEFTDPRVAFGNLEGYNYISFVATYREHCQDGCYPVNEELQLFLQRFAIANRLFNDGAGYAETTVGYNSDEDSMWMFACGYYKQ